MTNHGVVKRIGRDLEREWLSLWRDELRTRIWDGVFTKDKLDVYPITVVTTVMNRLEDLKKTLPRNMADNDDYPDAEFLVLDYGSTDGVEYWMKSWMTDEIKKGRVTYCRVMDGPKRYSMTHSRNIGFKAARGAIVLSVDADSYTDKEFLWCVCRMANEGQGGGVFFAKSRQLLRGRLGFWKRDFIDVLGGYDEGLTGYGHDDMDLMNRALQAGLKMMCFRKFCRRVEAHEKHATPENYDEAWWRTEARNRMLSYANLLAGRVKANEGREWGKARCELNFGSRTVET